MKILVTGGAGFIGSAVVRHLVRQPGTTVVNFDKLTYSGNLSSLAPVSGESNYHFVLADICDGAAVRAAFDQYKPDAVMHLAAESHVDRSIDGPADFIQTNMLGTFVLLDASLAYWRELDGEAREKFRFLHVSTDEVFGSLGAEGYFTEDTAYSPNSPYSASKAGSDHLARAWFKTYGLPVVVSNCSNNYGPYQYPEKLIPLMILSALEGKPLPVYGDGGNIRDWLYVEDHAKALIALVMGGKPGETYIIGGGAERTNIGLVRDICAILDKELPQSPHCPHDSLITFVPDRPGHDFRYAIDDSRIRREIGWAPEEDIESGLAKTVRWYLSNPAWWEPIRSEVYEGQRLGLGAGEGD